MHTVQTCWSFKLIILVRHFFSLATSPFWFCTPTALPDNRMQFRNCLISRVVSKTVLNYETIFYFFLTFHGSIVCLHSSFLKLAKTFFCGHIPREQRGIITVMTAAASTTRYHSRTLDDSTRIRRKKLRTNFSLHCYTHRRDDHDVVSLPPRGFSCDSPSTLGRQKSAPRIKFSGKLLQE